MSALILAAVLIAPGAGFMVGVLLGRLSLPPSRSRRDPILKVAINAAIGPSLSAADIAAGPSS